MQANIANAKKRPDLAVGILQEMIRTYPDRAKRESLRLTLTVAYEESGQLDKAILELQAMRQENESKEQIDLRIQRLEDRKGNQPGRRGRRK
jgi:lipopolysaccharide biosynthesis regulator YciM